MDEVGASVRDDDGVSHDGRSTRPKPEYDGVRYETEQAATTCSDSLANGISS